MDGDGDLDIVEVGASAAPQLYLNISHGNFSPGEYIGNNGYWKTLLVLGGIDGDDDTDIVVGTSSEENIRYLNNGDGTFPAATEIGTAENNSHAVKLGDLDGDGDPNYFSTDPDADLNGDEAVNSSDLGILKVMYFGHPGPSGLVP